jgi:hypothetical protein
VIGMAYPEKLRGRGYIDKLCADSKIRRFTKNDCAPLKCEHCNTIVNFPSLHVCNDYLIDTTSDSWNDHHYFSDFIYIWDSEVSPQLKDPNYYTKHLHPPINTYDETLEKTMRLHKYMAIINTWENEIKEKIYHETDYDTWRQLKIKLDSPISLTRKEEIGLFKIWMSGKQYTTHKFIMYPTSPEYPAYMEWVDRQKRFCDMRDEKIHQREERKRLYELSELRRLNTEQAAARVKKQRLAKQERDLIKQKQQEAKHQKYLEKQERDYQRRIDQAERRKQEKARVKRDEATTNRTSDRTSDRTKQKLEAKHQRYLEKQERDFQKTSAYRAREAERIKKQVSDLQEEPIEKKKEWVEIAKVNSIPVPEFSTPEKAAVHRYVALQKISIELAKEQKELVKQERDYQKRIYTERKTAKMEKLEKVEPSPIQSISVESFCDNIIDYTIQNSQNNIYVVHLNTTLNLPDRFALYSNDKNIAIGKVIQKYSDGYIQIKLKVLEGWKIL